MLAEPTAPPTHTHTHTLASPFSSSDLEEASNPKVTPRRNVHILGPAAAGWRLERLGSQGVGEFSCRQPASSVALGPCVCLSVCLSV